MRLLTFDKLTWILIGSWIYTCTHGPILSGEQGQGFFLHFWEAKGPFVLGNSKLGKVLPSFLKYNL